MKVKVTYASEEEREAAAVLAALLRLHPGAKMRRDMSQSPLLAVYMTMVKRETLEKSGEPLDPSPR